MKLFKKLLALAVTTFALSANAAVITFETPDTEGMALNFYRLQCSTYFTLDTGYCRGRASGDWVGFSYGSTTVTKQDGGRFDFNGSFITAAWNDDLNVDVLGYRDNVLVYDQRKIVSDDVATYFQFDYMNIDQLIFVGSGGTDAGTPGGGEFIAYDNFTFNEAAAVPEPGSFALLGLGLAGFAVARRRRTAA